MQHQEGTFQGAGGMNLYYQSWHPQGKVRATLAIVHGLGGHSGLYDNIVTKLISKNYAVYGFDLRGHGRSPGQRGYINSWQEFREDLGAFLQFISTQEPESPQFLLGHSLGGLMVLDYVLHCPTEASKLQGIITLAPSLGKVGVSPFKLTLGKILSRLLPGFTLNSGLDPSAASRDEKILVAYAQDPLRHTKGTARLATEFLATVAWVQSHAADLQVPLLILHGEADRVTIPQASGEFFQRVTFWDKKRVEYPGTYHEIQNDINYQEVLADLEDWLEEHLSTKRDTIETPLKHQA